MSSTASSSSSGVAACAVHHPSKDGQNQYQVILVSSASLADPPKSRRHANPASHPSAAAVAQLPTTLEEGVATATSLTPTFCENNKNINTTTTSTTTSKGHFPVANSKTARDVDAPHSDGGVRRRGLDVSASSASCDFGDGLQLTAENQLEMVAGLHQGPMAAEFPHDLEDLSTWLRCLKPPPQDDYFSVADSVSIPSDGGDHTVVGAGSSCGEGAAGGLDPPRPPRVEQPDSNHAALPGLPATKTTTTTGVARSTRRRSVSATSSGSATTVVSTATTAGLTSEEEEGDVDVSAPGILSDLPRARHSTALPREYSWDEERYSLYVIVVLRCKKNEGDHGGGGWQARFEVVGGASLEYYWQHQTALLAYVAVSAQHRGQGLAKVILQCAKGTIDAIGTTTQEGKQFGEEDPPIFSPSSRCPPPAKRLVIFVVPPGSEKEGQDDNSGGGGREGRNGVDRQGVWSHLGFRPVVGYSFVFPGHLLAEPHQMAVYRPDIPYTSSSSGASTMVDGSEGVTPHLEEVVVEEDSRELCHFLITVLERALTEEGNTTDCHNELRREVLRQERLQAACPRLRLGTHAEDWLPEYPLSSLKS